jgi:hypothetical protein
MTFDVFARVELERFFCRREELDKFYCKACLVQQLSRRGTRKVSGDAWTAATEDAFLRPGRLQVRSGRPCEICKELGLSLGVERLDTEVGDQPTDWSLGSVA